MSARAPFFPSGAASARPPTRNTNKPPSGGDNGNSNAQAQQQSHSTGNAFQPDLSNPLHASSGQNQPGKPNSNNGNASDYPRLNTSGLGGLKKKKALGPLATTGSFSLNSGSTNISNFGNNASSENAAEAASRIIRPGTADPSRGAQYTGELGRHNSTGPHQSLNPFGGNKNRTMVFGRRDSGGPKLIAPVPVSGAPVAPSSLLSNASYESSSESFAQFKTPSLLGRNNAVTNVDEDDYSQAHISGENSQGDVLEHDQDSSAGLQGFRPPFGPGHASDTSGTSSATLAEQDDDNNNLNSFGSETTGFLRSKDIFQSSGNYDHQQILPGMNTGARRIIVNDDQDEDEHGGDSLQQQHELGARIGFKQPNPTGQDRQHAGRKRTRESAGGAGYDLPDPKRLKTANADRRGGSREHDLYAQGQTFNDRRSNEPSAHQENEVYQHGRSHSVERPRGVLDVLLKMNTEESIKEHMGVYEQAVERWNSCSLDEWMAGPEELTAKFSEVLNFTKDRMSKQLKLYADLRGKVASHQEVLEDRKQMLATAREKVLEESTNVLG